MATVPALPDAVRVLLVEDDALLRTSLAGAMQGPRCTMVGAVGTAAEGMQIADHSPIDVLLTDLDLGDGPGGAVLAHAVRRVLPSVGVVVLTSYTDPRLIGTKRSQFPLGTEYLTKQSVSDLGILRMAVVRAALRGAEPTTTPSSDLSLTDNQVELMRLVARGLSNAEIASRRVIAEKSVEVAVSRILKELGIPADRSRNPRVEIARTYYALTGTAGAAGHGAITTT